MLHKLYVVIGQHVQGQEERMYIDMGPVKSTPKSPRLQANIWVTL